VIATITASAHKTVQKLMGNRFEITVVSNDKEWAEDRIRIAVAEIQRIEKLLTTFNEESQTNLINRFAGIKAVEIDREVFDLIQRSIRISELTQAHSILAMGQSIKNFGISTGL
jgi:thiamine biosynthesis lipoprotein